MLHNETYEYTFNVSINPAWSAGKLKATVLLINHDDSTVLNTGQLPFYLKIPEKTISLQEAGLYPNPSYDVAKVYFDVQQPENVHITLTDISGKTLFTYEAKNCHIGRNTVTIPVEQLSSGIYIINLVTDDGNKSLKLQVIH
jgi:Secretion system C-terminal sorting domain